MSRLWFPMVSLKFFIDLTFRLHCGRGFDSAANRNEYQEYFLGDKGGRCIGLSTLPPSCANCVEIWELELAISHRARPGLCRHMCWMTIIEIKELNVHNLNEMIVDPSSSMALQLWYSLDLLNTILPCKAVLDLFCPLYKLHLLQIILDIIFPSGLGPSFWSTCE